MQTLGKYKLRKQVKTENARASTKVKRQGQYFRITSLTSWINYSKSSFDIYGCRSVGYSIE